MIQLRKLVYFYTVLLVTFPPIIDFFFNESQLTPFVKGCCTLTALLIFTKNSSVTTKYSLLVPLSAVAAIIVANFFSSSELEPNLFVNILWIWIIANNQDFRNFFLHALLFAINPLLVLSAFTQFGILANIDSGLSSKGYFMPFNSILGLINRQQGIFSHPNTLSLYCLLSIGLIFSLKPSHAWFWVCLAIFELLTAGSRTFQILSLTLCLSVFIQSKLMEKPRIEMIFRNSKFLIIYLSCLTLLLLIATGIQENINQESLTGRIGIWQIALEVYRSGPIVGLGSNYASNEITFGTFPIGANSAHSLYLDALVTGGPLLLGSAIILVGRVVTNTNHGLNMQLFVISIALAGLTETIWTFYSFNAVNLLFAYLMSEKSKVHN